MAADAGSSRSRAREVHVAIEARALSAPGGGVHIYVQEFLRHLVPLGAARRFSVLCDGHFRPPPGLAAQVLEPVPVLGWLGWLHWQVPRSISRLRPDVVHFTKADVPKRSDIPTVVTLHDVIPMSFPEGQSIPKRWYWPGAMARAVANSDHLITLSQTSKRAILATFDIAPQRVTVTPPGVDRQRFKPLGPEIVDAVIRRYGIRVPYLLFVGSLEPRKNVPALIRAFGRIASQIPHTLVLVGRRFYKHHEIRSQARASGVVDRLLVLGYVPPGDLPGLYCGATLLVSPSIDEGWGLSPVEAMACGVPVVVSDGGSLPEAVGEAGAIVPFTADTATSRLRDPGFEDLLSETMIRIATHGTTRRAMRSAGLDRVQRFSWERTAVKTLEVYDRLTRR